MSDSFKRCRRWRFNAASACNWICETFGNNAEFGGFGSADDGNLVLSHDA